MIAYVPKSQNRLWISGLSLYSGGHFALMSGTPEFFTEGNSNALASL
jgi:hypothetical protein